jgi:hypothetical protein
MTAILVSSSFLNMKQFMPRWHLFLRILLVIPGGLMILGLFANYNTYAFTSSTFAVLYCMALLASSVQAVLSGYGPARYYTLAWFFVLGATVLNSLHYQGIMHPAFIVDFNSLPGAVFEGIHLNEVQLVEQEFETFLSRHKKLLKTDWGGVSDEVSLSLSKLKEIGTIVASDGDAALSARVQTWMEEVSQPVVGSIVSPMIASSKRTAKQLGKKVLVHVEGDDIRAVNAQETAIIESLTHLLRNSVIHGIEREREALGKPKAGLITLTFAADESALQIRLNDDGCGLTRKTWENAAQQRLHMSAKEASTLDLQDLVSRVIKSDFSIQKDLTMEAGRGIGLGGFLRSIEEAHGHYVLKSKEVMASHSKSICSADLVNASIQRSDYFCVHTAY